jgi:ATP-dependent DNA helicase RecG
MKESQRVEWKESWRDDCLKVICGFANAEGGTLTIGRNDAGDVVGAKDARKLLEDLPNKVRDILGIIVDVRLKKSGAREYVEIKTPPYSNPISYHGEFYYRTGSTSQALKGGSLERFLLRKQGRTWDGIPIPGVRVSQLSKAALKTFRVRARQSDRMPAELLREGDRVLLEKLRLFDQGYLRRAAALLFHEAPEEIFTGAYVKIGYFRTDSDLRYQDEIRGDLFSQVDRTVDTILLKYLRARITYEGIQRVETYPVPAEALREAITNAVAHKDYGSGIPIQISIYDDKLMIWNPGQLPHDWTAAHFTAKHASAPHNPDIANVFFRAALLESWGRGIDLIRDACRRHGFPKPEFRWDSGLWVEFPYAPEHAALSREVGRTTPITTLETTPITTLENTPVTTLEKILALLRSKPTLTGPQLATEVGITLDGAKYHLRRLRAAGILRHVGPRKSGRWEVLKKDSVGLPIGEVTGEVASEVARTWGTETRKKTGRETREKTKENTGKKMSGPREVRK